jgi:hypothetical protein
MEKSYWKSTACYNFILVNLKKRIVTLWPDFTFHFKKVVGTRDWNPCLTALRRQGTITCLRPADFAIKKPK